MYLLLVVVLLISPAFGRPSNGNQLSAFVNFNGEVGALLTNAKLIDIVVQNLKEAEQQIIEINAQLKIVEADEINLQKKYFPKFIEAKSYLRQTRQELRALADRTVKDVRDLKILLEDLDKTDDTVLLQVSIDKMKDLMIETLEKLKAAREKYNLAVVSFDNLNASIKVQNSKLKKMVTKGTAEYNDWTYKARLGLYGGYGAVLGTCLVVDIMLTFGLCNGVNTVVSTTTVYVTESMIEDYTRTIQNMQAVTGRLAKSGNKFDQAIKQAIGILTDEIDLIGQWTSSAKLVSQNCEKYPTKYLREYKSIRQMFKNGLNDLNNVAKKFLAQPVDILG